MKWPRRSPERRARTLEELDAAVDLLANDLDAVREQLDRHGVELAKLPELVRPLTAETRETRRILQQLALLEHRREARPGGHACPRCANGATAADVMAIGDAIGGLRERVRELEDGSDRLRHELGGDMSDHAARLATLEARMKRRSTILAPALVAALVSLVVTALAAASSAEQAGSGTLAEHEWMAASDVAARERGVEGDHPWVAPDQGR